MKRSKNKSSWIVTLPIAAASLLFVWFVFLPQKRAMDELRTSIQTKRDYITQAESLRPIISRAEDDMRASREYVERWSEKTPRESDLARVYARINELAHRAGAEVTRFDPAEIEPLATIQQAPITVQAEGSFTQVYQFLAAVEELPQAAWLDSVKLETNGKNGKNVSVAANLVIFADRSEKTD